MTKTALPFFSLHCNWLFYIIKLNKDQFNDNTSNIGIVGWCFLNIYFQQIMLFFWKYYFVEYLTWVAASITAKRFSSQRNKDWANKLKYICIFIRKVFVSLYLYVIVRSSVRAKAWNWNCITVGRRYFFLLFKYVYKAK